MKHGNVFYMELTRELFKEEYKGLSLNAKWLFVVLNELEQRYCSGQDSRDYFLRSDKDLAADSGMSMSTLKRTKQELIEGAPDLVITWQAHWLVDKQANRLSEKHITAYRILK